MQNKRNFYINGEWVAPLQPCDITVINPSDEQPCAVISKGSADDIDNAVTAARAAFCEWQHSDKARRLSLIKKILKVYNARIDDMAAAISLEMGAPITLAKESQAPAGSEHIENFIDAFESMTLEQPLSQNSGTQIIREPIGVCGLITPWNWPMNQIALKAIPALAAGCTMTLKPSEIAPLSAMVFAEIMDEAQCPAGVFNLVNGDGETTGVALSAHPQVDMMSFTGSTRAGMAVTRNAAATIKRVSLELGGKGANIIFADADEKAVIRGARHCFNNTGQSCNAPTRMLVERSRYAQAIEQAAQTAQKTDVNVAHKKGDHIGPLVSKIQHDKVRRLIEQGIKEGARLVAGGPDRPDGLDKGYFVRPTVFADVHNDMAIAREEIFGPVLSIIPFDSEEEAIGIANATDYGLTNYVQTQDIKKAKRIAKQLRSGMVAINGNSLENGHPFGGYKQSGNGREGGAWGIHEFMETKAISGWEDS